MLLGDLFDEAEKTGAPAAAVAEEETKWELIASGILGEEVLVVLAKRHLREARQAFPGTVLYFPAELEALARNPEDPEFLRLVHLAKKHLGAWVVPSDSPRGRWLRENRR